MGSKGAIFVSGHGAQCRMIGSFFRVFIVGFYDSGSGPVGIPLPDRTPWHCPPGSAPGYTGSIQRWWWACMCMKVRALVQVYSVPYPGIRKNGGGHSGFVGDKIVLIAVEDPVSRHFIQEYRPIKMKVLQVPGRYEPGTTGNSCCRYRHCCYGQWLCRRPPATGRLVCGWR